MYVAQDVDRLNDSIRSKVVRALATRSAGDPLARRWRTMWALRPLFRSALDMALLVEQRDQQKEASRELAWMPKRWPSEDEMLPASHKPLNPKR